MLNAEEKNKHILSTTKIYTPHRVPENSSMIVAVKFAGLLYNVKKCSDNLETLLFSDK